MDIYKIGNKAKCIIRSYAAGQYGSVEMKYDNQPYTILKDVRVAINFQDTGSLTRGSVYNGNLIGYNTQLINDIKISNVLLTDKILNLIYSKNEVKLCNLSENYESDENNQIFLNTNKNEVYQVFVYDDQGELEAAYGTSSITITVKKPNSSYLICYSVNEDDNNILSFDLNKFNNYYVALDFEIENNVNDTTSVMWIHLDKCLLTVDKYMALSRETNTINLNCKVINDNTTHNYITFSK